MTKTPPRTLASWFVLLAAAASPARASTLVAAATAADDGDRADAAAAPARYWDARLGMLAGDVDVGDSDGGSIGATAAFGYHRGDLALRGELAYYGTDTRSSLAPPSHGRATRAAALVRYAFVSTAPDDSFVAALWGEGGVGYERVAWQAGGLLERPDGEAAAGVDLGALRDGVGAHRKRLGYFMDVRSFVGEAPANPSAPVTCGGPCTTATAPPRTDVSVFFELGVNWGR